jgi:hypothetical protein
MKRLARIALGLLLLAAVVPSCELLEDCATCKLVTYKNGVWDSETTGILYCGEALAEKENSEPTTIGTPPNQTTTQWECN